MKRRNKNLDLELELKKTVKKVLPKVRVFIFAINMDK